MDINWREMLKHTLKYIAYIMFYLEESEFCLPLDGAMSSPIGEKCD